MANITVDANTRLYKLQALTSHEGDATKTLRAKHNECGDLVLYVKEGKSSFLDKALGRAERRENRAAEAVKTIFSNEMNALKDAKIGVRTLGNVAQDAIGQTVRTGDIGALASNVRKVVDMLPPRLAKPDAQSGIAAGLSMRDLGVNAADLSDPSADGLGDRIAAGFRNKPGVGEEDLHAFGRSGATRLREELTAALTQERGSSDGIETFVDAAVNRAVSQMLPDRAVANSKATIDGYVLHNITIGGQEFAPAGLLGKGGFGVAFEYRNVDNPSQTIALKLPLAQNTASIEDKAKAVDEFAKEAAMHRKAQGDGNEHVLGLKGEIRFPDGTLGLAMEIAPNGDAFKVSKSISEMVEKGEMTKAESDVLRLTMLKDMALGLQHMTGLGVQHLDFKSSNCFVGSDGVIKVADFGLTAFGKDVSINHFSAIPVANYLAPEILQKDDDARSAGNKDYKKAIDSARINVQSLLPNANDKTVKALATSIADAEKAKSIKSVRENAFITSAADAWGLGASAIEMLTGFLPFESSKPDAQLDSFGLAAYGVKPTETPLADGRGDDGKPLNGSAGVKTGDAAIDDLLTGLLQAKPKDRYTAGDVLQSAALKSPGVGSDEARALIAAIGSGKDDAIETAKAKLLWSMI